MMRIDSYRFGDIVIEGREYTSDVIIFPHRIKSDWWRKRGHEILPEDLKEVMEEKPEIIVVGTGESEMMKVLPETEHYIREQGIELITQATDKACQTYNQLCHSRKVVAALHLTC
jgi:hypothetical protein